MMAAPKVGLDEIIRKSEMGAVNELTYEYALYRFIKDRKIAIYGTIKNRASDSA